MRTDLHTLFDLGGTAIDAKLTTVLVSPELDGTSYEQYRGVPVAIPSELSL